MIEIVSVNELLMKRLAIPPYQRPYKWTRKNIVELLSDIDSSLAEAKKYTDYKYRIGSIILHKNGEVLDIVDGQQRIISLLLLKLYLDPGFSCSLAAIPAEDKLSQMNIHLNFEAVKDWFSLKSDDYKEKANRALSDILQAVIITVEKTPEAFQLFDSQNTRGKALDPHDLLKAYHLRAMADYPYEMKHAVTKWEAVKSSEIHNLFNSYLYPIWKWSRCEKAGTFTAQEIDIYKGVSESSNYPFAKRAKKAVPFFQLTEPFVEGEDFFEMVDHYLLLLSDIRQEISDNVRFEKINKIIGDKYLSKEMKGRGFVLARELFYSALLCYYDKFHNFEERSVHKLFLWALMLRVDMENLGYDSINKYATGERNDRYTNVIPMFSVIARARSHNEIANLRIVVRRKTDHAQKDTWEKLYNQLLEMNGEGA